MLSNGRLSTCRPAGQSSFLRLVRASPSNSLQNWRARLRRAGASNGRPALQVFRRAGPPAARRSLAFQRLRINRKLRHLYFEKTHFSKTEPNTYFYTRIMAKFYILIFKIIHLNPHPVVSFRPIGSPEGDNLGFPWPAPVSCPIHKF